MPSNNSNPIAIGDDAIYTQYNNVRLDALSHYNFGDGSDGALDVQSGTTTIDCGSNPIVIKQYTSVDIASGATLTFSNVSDKGLTFIMLVTGDTDIAGKIDGKEKGQIGGLGVTATVTVQNTSDAVAGNKPASSQTNIFIDDRNGEAGNADTSIGGGGGNGSAGTATNGAGGSSSPTIAGGDSSAVSSSSNSGSATAAASDAGETVTLSENWLLNTLDKRFNLHTGPGGSSAGAATRNTGGQNPYTATASSGNGGRGGFGIHICGYGDITITGEIDSSGGNPGASSASAGDGSGQPNEWSSSASASGSAPGGGGPILIEHGGTLTDGAATYTTNSGTVGTGSEDTDNGGGGSNGQYVDANSSSSGISAAGTVYKVQLTV